MIKTGNPVISIYTEMTPNPETMKFVANKLLYPGKSIDFPDVESAKPSPLAMMPAISMPQGPGPDYKGQRDHPKLKSGIMDDIHTQHRQTRHREGENNAMNSA